MGCQKLPGDAPDTHIRPIEPTPMPWERILAYDLKLNLAIAKNVHQRRSYCSPSFESTTWMRQEIERSKLRQFAPSDQLVFRPARTTRSWDFRSKARAA